MFINNLNLPDSQSDKDIFLLDNFLQKLPEVVTQLTRKLSEINSDILNEMKIQFSVPDLFKEQFSFLNEAKRKLTIRKNSSSENLYTKLTENGLTENMLILKMKILDWFWKKTDNLSFSIKNVKNSNLLRQFINLLKSLLCSLLSALGLNSDVYQECFDLLSGILEMRNK